MTQFQSFRMKVWKRRKYSASILGPPIALGGVFVSIWTPNEYYEGGGVTIEEAVSHAIRRGPRDELPL